ncbi:Protein O-mannosyltransferase 2 [Lunasporangiospora selenospora]|uniref:Dolichyl-phosphate-mannose--protein mannosyltransferase n=1 Tax=Lunasporangiospora selenospora TaxID=979761 RepID=A0A9P6KAL3_9FUNG|nr:Protein O-mannosyltransferase 2 [Lunasporangiospora selenospora]
MLVGLSGVLGGYDGTFDFPSGSEYPNINYRFMRLFNAAFGVAMVPLAFLTARELKMSLTGAAFAATMVMLDNAYVTICRYILLDSMLLASTLLVVFCLSKFRNTRHEAFSWNWFQWLTLTGVSIGVVSSVKWVGLFVTALVGLYTIEELWGLLGHSNMTIAGLNGTSLKDIPLEIAFGSRFTMKNNGYNGGLLHSHVQTYPEGSRQQQITCYHHNDTNNMWFFKRPTSNPLKKVINSEGVEEEEIQFIHTGDTVRLVHFNTRRNLHSHQIRAPVTYEHWEVSGYGEEEDGDENDEWIVEIVDEQSNNRMDGTLRALASSFVLRHKRLGCLLTAERTSLPSWGFNQIEVFCDRRAKTNRAYSIWNVEHHWNERLPPGKIEHYKSRFWSNFWHLNVAMMNANNNLIPDPDKNDRLASNPMQWPLLAVGLRMNGWNRNSLKIWLIGNPIVWWCSAASLVIYVLMFTYYSITRSRHFSKRAPVQPSPTRSQSRSAPTPQPTPSHTPSSKSSSWGVASFGTDASEEEWDHFKYVGKTMILGWFLHFIPFCIMGRVTYLHHYFPALYFVIMLFAYLVDHALTREQTEPNVRKSIQRNRLRIAFWTIAYAAVIGTFVWFWPASYGNSGPADEAMANRQWRSAWDIIDPHGSRSFM